MITKITDTNIFTSPLRIEANDQMISLDRREEYARQILRGDNEDRNESSQLKAASTLTMKNKMAPGLTKRLDDACLELSIALLDHELPGDLFESAVVGFLAALGIDAVNQTYEDIKNRLLIQAIYLGS